MRFADRRCGGDVRSLSATSDKACWSDEVLWTRTRDSVEAPHRTRPIELLICRGRLQGSTSREARTTANSASSIRRRVTDRNRLLRTDARLMTSCMPA